MIGSTRLYELLFSSLALLDNLDDQTPQKQAGGRQYPWPRSVSTCYLSNTPTFYSGKGLGGSSAMNFHCIIPPPASDIDSRS